MAHLEETTYFNFPAATFHLRKHSTWLQTRAYNSWWNERTGIRHERGSQWISWAYNEFHAKTKAVRRTVENRTGSKYAMHHLLESFQTRILGTIYTAFVWWWIWNVINLLLDVVWIKSSRNALSHKEPIKIFYVSKKKPVRIRNILAISNNNFLR